MLPGGRKRKKGPNVEGREAVILQEREGLAFLVEKGMRRVLSVKGMIVTIQERARWASLGWRERRRGQNVQGMVVAIQERGGWVSRGEREAEGP